MRILIDYRPALRGRSGVGEYVHQLSRTFAEQYPDDRLTLFTSSWKDRPDPQTTRELAAARVSDHRIPVRVLNLAWHNLEWPPAEWLTGERYDVAFSPHPLLLPVRKTAQAVMVHDLDFLRHPERTHGEIRRDYPRLAGAHARRAGVVIVPSEATADDVHRTLEVPRDRIAVCSPGVPDWPAPVRGFNPQGYLLFVGTLEPRKNVAGLLAAYRHLVASGLDVPKLVLVGKPGAGAAAYLATMNDRALAGRVEHLGYVAEINRQRIYEQARALVLPSFDEGFGMPVLEAMSLGVPVVASARGGLPELVGDGGLLVDPTDHVALADALADVLCTDRLAATLGARAHARAGNYSWRRTAAAVYRAFASAVAIRAAVSRSDARSRTDPRTAPGIASR